MKTSAAATGGRARTRFGWSDVLRVLQTDETRSYVAGRIRNAGISRESWGGTIEGRLAVADALTRVEDRLELAAGPKAATMRVEVRGLRRRIEDAAA